MTFWRLWSWSLKSSGIWRRVVWRKYTDVSEEPAIVTIRVHERGGNFLTFQETSPFRDRVVRSSRFSWSYVTRLPKYTASCPRVEHCPSCRSCLTSSFSVLFLPFPIRRSSFCVCSILLPAMDQWRKLLSFSCFIPSPRQKKPTLTILAHTLEPCPVLLGNSSPGGMWVSLPEPRSLALLSHVQRGKLIRNGAQGWGPYCLVIFM